MLINEIEDVNIEEFKETFKKKFSSLCEKSPLLLSYKTMGDTVVVIDKSYNESLETKYDLDYMYDVKLNIKKIKDDLETRYPIVNLSYEQPISDDKAHKLLQEGHSLDEIIDMNETIEIPKYKSVHSNDYDVEEIFKHKIYFKKELRKVNQ
jgi:CRISPR/Cas system CMR-associated protein Cmr5 small subunit